MAEKKTFFEYFVPPNKFYYIFKGRNKFVEVPINSQWARLLRSQLDFIRIKTESLPESYIDCTISNISTKKDIFVVYFKEVIDKNGNTKL